MPRHISKAAMFRVTVAIDDDLYNAMKEAPEIAKESLQEGAFYWQTKILPKHFEPAASGRYGYAPRSNNYSRNPEKGSKPDMVFSGSLRRDMKAKAELSESARGVNLRLSARVFNFAPAMPENTSDLYVRQRNGKGYPNLKRELHVVSEDEKAAIAAVIKEQFTRRFNGPR